MINTNKEFRLNLVKATDKAFTDILQMGLFVDTDKYTQKSYVVEPLVFKEYTRGSLVEPTIVFDQGFNNFVCKEKFLEAFTELAASEGIFPKAMELQYKKNEDTIAELKSEIVFLKSLVEKFMEKY